MCALLQTERSSQRWSPNQHLSVARYSTRILWQYIRLRLTLDRPAYVGMCTLDLSKTLVYDFHYNKVKKIFGDKAKLLFTDTDSLCYEITTEDAYEDLGGIKFCLTLVITQKIAHFMIQQTKNYRVNLKMNSAERL